MGNENTSNIFGKSAGKASFLITKNFNGFVSQKLDLGAGPLLPLPVGFNGYTVSYADYPGTFIGRKLKLICPAAKEPLTAYCNEFLRTYMTIEFVRLVSQLPFPAAQPFLKDDRLEYAVSVFNAVYKLPTTTDDPNVRSTFAYYLSPSFDNIYLYADPDIQTKLIKLKDSLKSIEAKYNAILIQQVLPTNTLTSDGKTLNKADKPLVDFFNLQKGGKVLDQADAQTFIENITEQLKLDIDVFFAEAQIKVRLFNADPFISDPRFRLSITDSRWNDYDEIIKQEVAFYNQKFAGKMTALCRLIGDGSKQCCGRK